MNNLPNNKNIIDSIYLLSILTGLEIVSNQNNIIIANVSRAYKDGVKYYLKRSEREFKILSIESNLFGFTIKLKVLNNIVFSSTGENTLPNKDNITTIDIW